MRVLRTLVTAMTLGIGAGVAAQVAMPSLTPAQLAAFPAGAGREETVRVCSGCHAPEIIVQQRMAPADWERTVDEMAGRGAKGTDAEFAAIAAYLGKTFPG